MTKMKDSGIEWIGEVPEEWGICRIKDIYSFFTGTTPDTGKTEFYGDENGSTWITISDMQEKYVKSSKQTLSELFITSKLPMQSPKGSLLYSFKLSVGKVSFAQQDLYTNEAIATFLANDKVCLRFLYYSSFLIEFNAEVNIYGAKILNKERINNAFIINPTLLEQTQIADFLDKKVAQLDKVKSLLEEQIKTLEDYRQSLIYETVTKGLDKTVPLKESGVDWIGQIPEGWGVGRVKDCFILRTEKSYLPMEDVQLLSLYTEYGVFPHGEREEKGNKAVTTEGYKVVFKNDIVVNIILAWMGSIGMSGYDGVTSPAYDIYKPLESICSRYYHYLFRTMAFSGQCYKYGRGIMKMRWRTYSNDFKIINVPIPCFEIQTQIADFLDKKTEQINQMIAIKKEQIENINKQRQTLIYDYVTGKRRV
ncbi:restriction endonuclease subunit S [Streptococcus suis]|uniref:restriction endonuclease subunit S n=2 Tax=Streptococcus suis TaxID=1307 RepID=UPI000CF6189C|nr:restriction endonuclease subunit S [Streptococcus suis]MCH1637529.1 restriction endonuclease subunit S [Streptococcus suis]MCH1648356.1 restriction endonuclease subunit S [Streptococcus suis]MCK3942082.1 restriction endonuclease subunit S [Streptococcus suis]TQE45853.1 restriction endonuclease subunit S [Streptococcus suis]HEM3071914.1 restriction endonuclease subunit S [Streptococcus suis]